MSYTYKTYSASNGVTLLIIQTTASNIMPTTFLGKAMLDGETIYGINGGWFNSGTDQQLNISGYNGLPSGCESSSLPQHTGMQNSVGSCGIAYNPTTKKMFSYNDHSMDLNSYKDAGASGSGSWVQGGQSLFLGDKTWYTRMCNDWFRDYHDAYSDYWTGMVVNINNSDVHLIVGTKGNDITFKPEAFRTAIMNYINLADTSVESGVYKGIILDGGGSSSINCKEKKIARRKLCGVIRIKEK